MSVNTWTPTALASELVAWQGGGWRAVEAQHKVATMALVRGDAGAQRVLEDILEEKQAVVAAGGARPALVAGDALPLLAASRRVALRRRHDAGVFYGAEERENGVRRSWLKAPALLERERIPARRSRSVALTLFAFSAVEPARARPDGAAAGCRSRYLDGFRRLRRDAGACRKRAPPALEALRYESARRRAGRCLAFLSPRCSGRSPNRCLRICRAGSC